jgi:transposase
MDWLVCSSPEVIRLVVMMYIRFPLSLRNVEDLLSERGIDICHETVRLWWNRFGPMFAADIRRQRASRMRGFRQWRWHLDEMYVRLNGEIMYLWRAVDQALNRCLLVWHRQDQASQRLATIPGVDVISATALAASVTDPSQFRSGREFSASLGLVPRQNSSGSKDRLGRISKMGDRYLRKLLVVGATSVVRRARTADTTAANWLRSLLERKPARLVTVAMANKTALIVWAVLARGETYRSPAPV